MFCLSHVAMGQKFRSSVNIPIPTRIDQNGAPAPKWDPIGFDNHSHVSEFSADGLVCCMLSPQLASRPWPKPTGDDSRTPAPSPPSLSFSSGCKRCNCFVQPLQFALLSCFTAFDWNECFSRWWAPVTFLFLGKRDSVLCIFSLKGHTETNHVGAFARCRPPPRLVGLRLRGANLPSVSRRLFEGGFSILFNHPSFKNRLVPPLFFGFPEKTKTPGKNGEGSPRVF